MSKQHGKSLSTQPDAASFAAALMANEQHIPSVSGLRKLPANLQQFCMFCLSEPNLFSYLRLASHIIEVDQRRASTAARWHAKLHVDRRW
jgi:hypothetical protein